jgi:hypothetical protein
MDALVSGMISTHPGLLPATHLKRPARPADAGSRLRSRQTLSPLPPMDHVIAVAVLTGLRPRYTATSYGSWDRARFAFCRRLKIRAPMTRSTMSAGKAAGSSHPESCAELVLIPRGFRRAGWADQEAERRPGVRAFRPVGGRLVTIAGRAERVAVARAFVAGSSTAPAGLTPVISARGFPVTYAVLRAGRPRRM